jgi:hypothetical protein
MVSVAVYLKDGLGYPRVAIHQGSEESEEERVLT